MAWMRAVLVAVVAVFAQAHFGRGDDRVPLGFTAVDLNAERANLPGNFPANVKSGFVIRSVDFDLTMERWGLRPGDVVIFVGPTPVSEQSFRAWYDLAKTNTTYSIAYLRRNTKGVYVRNARRHAVPQQPQVWLGAAAYDVYPARLRPGCVDYWKEWLTDLRGEALGLLIEITDYRPEFLTQHYSPTVAAELKDALRERKTELKMLAKQQAHNPPPPNQRRGIVGLRRNRTPMEIDGDIVRLAKDERWIDDERKNNPPRLPYISVGLMKVGQVVRVAWDNSEQFELIRKYSDRSGLLAPQNVTESVRIHVDGFDFSKYSEGMVLNPSGPFEITNLQLTPGHSMFWVRSVPVSPPVKRNP